MLLATDDDGDECLEYAMHDSSGDEADDGGGESWRVTENALKESSGCGRGIVVSSYGGVYDCCGERHLGEGER